MEKILEQVCRYLETAGIKYTVGNNDDSIMLEAVLNKGGTRSLMCSISTHPTPSTEMRFLVFNAFIVTDKRKGADAFLEVEEPIMEDLVKALNEINSDLVHGNVSMSPYGHHLGYRVSTIVENGNVPENVFGMLWNSIGVVAGKLWETYNMKVMEAFLDGRLTELPAPFDSELMKALERSGENTKMSTAEMIDTLTDGKGKDEILKVLAQITLEHLKAREVHESEEQSSEESAGEEAPAEDKPAESPKIEQAEDEGSVLKQSMNDAQGY